MASQTVQPLRIQKGGPGTSPIKMNNTSSHRPLSELSPMERRRNSPSFNQATKSMLNGDSSSFEASPYNQSVDPASPRVFWQGRDPASPARFGSENNPHGYRDGSPSPSKRSSIENLKRASRVKNSNMFAREVNREYDPASIPNVERPLAGGRPLSVQVKSNAFGGRGMDALRAEFIPKGVEKSKMSTASPEKAFLSSTAGTLPPSSPSKEKASPTKSSLSKSHRFPLGPSSFDPEVDAWSEDDSSPERQLPPGRVLHRHAKSVTFDSGPPQVNEYEMTTPEQSSVGTASRESSYDSVRDDTLDDEGSSQDQFVGREDSFDPRLEDIDETPVVDPEDWRHMSPTIASANRLQQNIEDPFDGEERSPTPAAVPHASNETRPNAIRTDSNGSTGERRPLPPVPDFTKPRSYSTSSQGLSGVAERRDSGQRILPSPPAPASTSKSEILGMRGSSMTLQERLHLMMNQDEMGAKSDERYKSDLQSEVQHTTTENQVETTASPTMVLQESMKDEIANELSPVVHQPAPRISRASILRRVKSQSHLLYDPEINFSSPLQSSTPDHSLISGLDPDTPLPSTEAVQDYDDTETSVIVKQEQDSDADISSIPDFYNHHFVDATEEHLREESVLHHEVPKMDDDDQSHYSQDSAGTEVVQHDEGEGHGVQGTATPRPYAFTTNNHNMAPRQSSNRMSLPEFASLLGDDALNFGLESYMTPSPNEIQDRLEETSKRLLAMDHPSLQRPVTPDHQLLPPALPTMYGPECQQMDMKTPESIAQHPIQNVPSPEGSPVVPEPVATIKARGSKLKTRPSATPADLAAMATNRRQVSGEIPNGSVPPPIPERHRDRPSIVPELQNEASTTATSNSAHTAGNRVGSKLDRRRSGRKSLIKLDVPMSSFADDLSLGLDKEFDRVLETQKVAFELSLAQSNFNCGVLNGPLSHSETNNPLSQLGWANRRCRPQRGYLMRQNTKMVVASSRVDEAAPSTVELPPGNARGSRSAGNSPRKPSHDRSQSWHVEPWNNNARRKSIRDGSGMPKKKPVDGPVPPLPGQESNVTRGLTNVLEDEVAVEKPESDVERGRLFVKVVGVRDLNLPLVKGQPSWFNVTLDNGIHCVQTAWLELGKNAPIGQEFELIVLDDLEFTLTLQTEAPKPPVQQPPESPTKSIKTPKPSAFSRVFASPKKRRELEKKQQEEDQRAGRQKQQDAQSKKSAGQPTAWDLLHGVVASDGTFARAYFSLKEHEACAYGRPYAVETDCFNEWATEPATTGSSIKSKRGDVQKRPPYRIGKLELQLLFVPKPKGAQDADMPKSLNACVRELREAEANASRRYEGHLSQQGGDCPYWRRRFFKLDGSKLTAYHETSRQPRATISLAKATKLIDDRSALLQKEVSGKGRRKSGFAEDEEGYMFVEEGFRIRFANGEIIDFYADSAAEKEGWMKVLGEVVGKKITTGKAWTDLVLARERASTQQQQQQRRVKSPPPARKPSAASSSSNARTESAPSRQAPAPPPPIEKSPRHQQSASVESTPQMNRRTQPAPRSMIF